MSAAAVFCAVTAEALTLSNRYRSPRNPERRLRASTRLIVLHTTEAPARSSLNKLSERGEAHYCLVEDGTVYRIIDRDRVAFHAGRSMWRGKEDCDEFSIGIEVVGYHNKPMPLRQLNALRELVGNLKKLYGIRDVQVVCHSHVAYGVRNKWQKCSHRGRKRCGMLFAMWSVRRKLALSARPALDPDVKSGRLVQADKYLESVLYGRTDTMAVHYAGGADPANKSGLFSGLGNLLKLGGDKRKPAPKAAVKAKAPKKAAAKAAKPPASAKPPGAASPNKWRSSAKFVAAPAAPRPVMKAAPKSTRGNYYLLPNGKYFRDDRLPKDIKLASNIRRLLGYRLGGPLGPGKSAYSVAGKAWNAPTTYYVMGGKVYVGSQLKASDITRGAMVFFKDK